MAGGFIVQHGRASMAIVGAGSVDLVTSACLADAGERVILVEKDPKHRSLLLDDAYPILEQGPSDAGPCGGEEAA